MNSFLSYAFRPFFLLTGLSGVILVSIWVASLHGAIGMPGTLVPAYWHGHEMIVGFAMATIAGFTLSAVATWTGRPAVNGLPLTLLAGAWLVGRMAVYFSNSLPLAGVVILDSLFPFALVLLFAREVFGARNLRNYKVVGIVFALALFNVAYYLWDERRSLYLLIHTVAVLVALIGGRILPNFTANWLRGQGATDLPANDLTIDRMAMTLSMMVGLSAALYPQPILLGFLAALATGLHGVRVLRWKGLRTASNPLLFVLHVAYWWLPVGYALTAAAALGVAIPPTAALHALTMGSIGTMVVAMLTRVPLGHTGRALQASRLAVAAYWLITFAVLLRILSTLMPGSFLTLLDVSAVAWCLAFAIFTAVYWPVLTGPPAK